jgi:hypothetical protein
MKLLNFNLLGVTAMKKILFLSCIVAALSAVPAFCITGLTPLTGVTGTTNFPSATSGITGASAFLSTDGTTLAEGGPVDETPFAAPAFDEVHSYDLHHLAYLCKRIHEIIAVIGTFLFAEQTGLLTDVVLKEHEQFYFYEDINDRAISNAMSEFNYDILCLQYLRINCVAKEKGAAPTFDPFGNTHFASEIKMPFDVIFARYAVKEKYEQLVQWFASCESWLNFLVNADCSIQTNEALADFMKNQLILGARTVMSDFEQSYKTFITAAQKSFETAVS